MNDHPSEQELHTLAQAGLIIAFGYHEDQFDGVILPDGEKLQGGPAVEAKFKKELKGIREAQGNA